MASWDSITRSPLVASRAFRWRNRLLDVLVALCLAFLVWLYTRSRDQETLDQVLIPVQVKLAPKLAGQYELNVQGSSKVMASFTGPPSRIRELRRQIQRGLVQVDVNFNVPDERQNDNSYSESVGIAANSIPVPPGVMAVVPEEGNTVSVTAHKLVERQLPVRLDYAGEFRLTQLKIEPVTVTVKGPKEVLDRARVINTQPFSLPSMPEAATGAECNVREQIALVGEMDGRPIQASPASVSFRCRVQPRQRVYELAEVPVHFLCPLNFPWRPRFASGAGKINLRVIGPTGEEVPPVTAYVDLTQGNLGQGRNLEPLRLNLPRDFQLTQEAPPVIPFFLDPLDLQPAAAAETSAP